MVSGVIEWEDTQRRTEVMLDRFRLPVTVS